MALNAVVLVLLDSTCADIVSPEDNTIIHFQFAFLQLVIWNVQYVGNTFYLSFCKDHPLISLYV